VPHPSRRVLLLLLVALALASGCTGGKGEGSGGTTQAPKPPLTYVAVGASETVGTGADKPATEAWPRVLADKLGEGGRQVTFTNLGFGGARVPEALASSVPKAEQLQANLATVWLNVNDIIGEFVFPGVAKYDQQLDELVRRLRRGGATTVLVANTPALDRLPAYLECLNPAGTRCPLPAAVRPMVPQPDVVRARVEAYNVAIARIVQQQGAVLVDLHAAGERARKDGIEASLVSADGFHPSTAGHAAVAEAFAEAAKQANV
jgi:lysophospholipase L1-like esterase